MARLSTLYKEHAQRVATAKQLLQQKAAMLRLGLTPLEYLCVKTGCSIAMAERLLRDVADQ